MASNKQREYDRERERLIKAFEAGGSDLENSVDLDEAVRALIIDLLALQNGLDSSDSAVRAKLWDGANAQMQSWDPDEPELTHSAKLLRLLALTRDGSSTNYADNLQTYRKTEERARQAKRASNPHQESRFNALLKLWVSRDPDLGPEGVIKKIRAGEAISIVIDLTATEIEIYPFEDSEEKSEVRKISRSGLGSRLSRIKKALSAVT